MKHLNLRSVSCLPALLVLTAFTVSLLMPHSAMARVEYTCGTGMAEGDPTDGLGFSGGGGGSLLPPPDKIHGEYFVTKNPLLLPVGTIFVPGHIINIRLFQNGFFIEQNTPLSRKRPLGVKR